jgi:nucleoside-diphosphate-sugar epimerase
MQAQHGDDITVFGDGSQTRSFCYVTDSVTGILRFTEKTRPSVEVLNLGTDEEKKILYLAGTVKKLTSSSSAIRFLPFPKGDHKRRLPDTRRCVREIDWTPMSNLENGLKKTILWLKSKQFPKKQLSIS